MSIFRVVFITAPVSTSKKIAREIVGKRLAACVNITPKLKSIYWWKGKIDEADESLMIVKTKQSHLSALYRLMKKIHPYTVPEIISLPITAGNKPYLQWLAQETK